MKKEIVDKLIKVANNLDSLGYMREANIVDRVAKKIVLSANPEVIRLQKGEASSIVPSGDYATDIANYKRLYYNGYYDAFDKFNEKGYSYYLNLAKNFYINALKKYEGYTKHRVFIAQAERIRKDIKLGAYHIEANVDIVNKNKPLNYYLKKYNLVDDNGYRKQDVDNIVTFNTRWNNLLKEPDFVNYKYKEYLNNQLDATETILKESIPRQQGQ